MLEHCKRCKTPTNVYWQGKSKTDSYLVLQACPRCFHKVAYHEFSDVQDAERFYRMARWYPEETTNK
jgi:hypothetical protein